MTPATPIRIGKRFPLLSLSLLLTLLLLAGCSGDGGDRESDERWQQRTCRRAAEPVKLDPAEFTTNIDNPYWPMSPGTRWVYRETRAGGEERVVVTVTDRTRMIANGIQPGSSATSSRRTASSSR